MKRAIYLFALACMSAGLFVFTGCEDKDYFEPEVANPTEVTGEASTLDFSTTQGVKFMLNYDVPAGYVAAFDVYAENPYTQLENGKYKLKEDVKPLAAGISISGKYNLTKTLPAYVSELYVHSNNLFVPELMYAKIENGIASFEMVDLNMPEMEVQETRSINSGGVDYFLGTNNGSSPYAYRGGFPLYIVRAADVDEKHRPNYIDADKTEEIDAAILQKINSAFPDRETPVGPTVGDASVYLEKEAELWVSVIHSEGDWDNSLSYFAYNGKKEDLAGLSSNAKSNLLDVVVFPLTKLNTKDADLTLKAGEYVQLKYQNAEGQWVDKFPAGTTVGWVLRAASYSRSNKTVSNNSSKVYSVPAWNKDGKNATVLFNANPGDSQNPFICFGFEDDLASDSDNDMNDVIFHVKSNPSNAIIEIPEIPGPDPITTYDVQEGIISFEDSWPNKGDYDLNDVVVHYNSTSTLYAEGGEGTVAILTERTDVFSLLHTGADYNNAFAYKVDWTPTLLESITIDGEAYTPVADGDGFIVKLTDDVADEIPSYGKGIVPSPKVYTVAMKFKEEVLTEEDSNDLLAPYNPYISPAQTPGAEVHLAGYLPTSNADEHLFGKGDDYSDQPGYWYVGNTERRYPFAIHLSGVSASDFTTIPTEAKAIEYTYPKYTDWVNNGCGKDDSDWYLYPNNPNN